MTAAAISLESIVDVDRYPVHEPRTAGWRALVEHCRDRLAVDGGCDLEGFVRQSAVSAVVAEAEGVEAQAHRAVGRANASLRPPTRDTPVDHPDRVVGRSELGVVADDRIRDDGILRALYEWDALRTFLAAAYLKDEIFPYGDDMRPINVFVMRDGDQNWWHLDQVDFTTILQIRSAEQGGVFEYVPLPPIDDPGRSGLLRRVVTGGAAGSVRTMERPAGSLQLFRGRDVVHRVTRVRGSVSRLTAILGFDATPDKVSSAAFQRGRYGRVGAIVARGGVAAAPGR